MKSVRHRSLLFAGLFALVSGTFWFAGCRPTSGQGAGEGGHGDTGGRGGTGSGGDEEGSGGSGEGGEEGGEGGRGGTTDTGGKSGTGGKTGEGGSASTGGSTSAGGAGGSTGTAGSSVPSSGGSGGGGTTAGGNTVTIASGKGSGAMVGYAWVALGSQDQISDPTCGGTPITSTTRCEETTWSTKDSLCVSAKIPELPPEPSDSDYTNNWGISVGLNASETEGKGIGQTFSTVSISLTGSPSVGLRAQVHKAGDPEGTSYCVEYKTGPLQLSTFSQDCWAGAPTKMLAASDFPNIDQVAVQVYSGGAAITVDKLCITGIAFGN